MPSPVINRPTAETAVNRLSENGPEEMAAKVQEWTTKAGAPALTAEATAALADLVLQALATPVWRDEFYGVRENNPDVARARRIADALRTLQQELPPFIDAWRGGSALFSIDDTMQLYEAVGRHQGLLDQVAPRGRGRAQSQEADLRALLARNFETLNPQTRKKAADTFAALAMEWLLIGRRVKLGADTISRTRRRRTQKP